MPTNTPVKDGLYRFRFLVNTPLAREITPRPGDTFAILQRWHDLDPRGNVTAGAPQEGGALTFGDQMFNWEELNAASAEYQVSSIVEELTATASRAMRPSPSSGRGGRNWIALQIVRLRSPSLTPSVRLMRI